MSFRARLTLSYAIFASVLLTIVIAALVGFVLYLSTRPISEAVEKTAQRIQKVVDADRGRPEGVVVADIRALPVPDGVIVRVNELRRLQPLLAPGVAEFKAGFGGPPDVHVSGAFVTGPGPNARFRASPLDMSALFAMRPLMIHIAPGVDAFIAPDLRQARAITKYITLAFLVALVLTLFAAWAIGRWITDQAVAPLVAIAGELRRFAAGDFTPRVVSTTDRSEVGALAEAYNGAAEQVSAAFQERARVEAHMRRFLGEAGHEMRTPLTVISGYLDVLERGGWDDPDVRELALPTMRAEARRLRGLVERLMTLARLEGDDHEAAEIIDVVSSATDAIAEVTAARGGRIRLRADGDHVVFAEPAEVYEAIVNLIDNAVKYGAGTPVDVTIAREVDGTVLRVTDRGPGITKADRERLFERFFRGEAANGTEGSGLGLAIVERAAERSHGKVALESAMPGETTFTLTFPPYRALERERSVIVLG